MRKKHDTLKNTDKKSNGLNPKEQELYDNLKRSLLEIKEWENGKLELKDAKDMLNEL